MNDRDAVERYLRAEADRLQREADRFRASADHIKRCLDRAQAEKLFAQFALLAARAGWTEESIQKIARLQDTVLAMLAEEAL